MNAEGRLLAGLSSYSKGELLDAAQHCKHALDDNVPSDALAVRLIHLYLIATELWWSIDPTGDVGNLVMAAQKAAARTGDQALVALAQCMHGRYLIATNGLREAVAVFSEAANIAAESDNLLAKLEVLSDLGHHSVGRNLERGLAILRQAQTYAENSGDSDAIPLDGPLLPVARARLTGLIGVAIYDGGRFEEGEVWLRRSLKELRALRAWDLFASISNYLGQLLTDLGRFEEAESNLLEALKALEVLQAKADLSTAQGYNLGLLGKLYLEWGRIDEAESSLKAGWDRLQRTRHHAILPILRNYVGELLMHPSYSARDVRRADQLFEETIAECRESGFRRSEVMALTLSALASLALADQDAAVRASAQAVTQLETAGTMPALRTEEVYLMRYRVLDFVGDQIKAERSLARARQILLEKAATVGTPEQQAQFLTRVPTSLAIMNASRSLRQ